MSDYWKNHYDAVSRRFDASPLKQVGKTVNGREIPEQQVELIVANVAGALRLSAEDSVVDLCCGNGLLTREFAPLVKNVVAVDFTAGLIDSAKRHHSCHNVQYINADVLHLDHQYFLGFKKVIMYEALQHFSEEQLAGLLDDLGDLEAGSLFFLGSIPNKEKLHVYYDTEEKFAFYTQCESAGRPHMGRWWLMDEIDRLASVRAFKPTFLAQPPELYTAYYRFDVLLEKCA